MERIEVKEPDGGKRYTTDAASPEERQRESERAQLHDGFYSQYLLGKGEWKKLELTAREADERAWKMADEEMRRRGEKAAADKNKTKLFLVYDRDNPEEKQLRKKA